MRLSRNELKDLMKNKMAKAGLKEDHAETAAEILTWADERGYHSHGAVRVASGSPKEVSPRIRRLPGKRTVPAAVSWMGIMDAAM